MYMNHVAGSKMLVEIHDIMKALSIPHFLIDIGVLYENFKQKTVTNLVGALLMTGFDVEQFMMPFTRVRTVVAFKRYGDHIVKADIVGWIKWGNDRFTTGPVRNYCEKSYALVHEAEMLESYTPSIELWGRVFNLPAMIERYLLIEYGPDWRTPKDDSRSRTRVYNYLELENIPEDYLEHV
jgi:hypothetical protein